MSAERAAACIHADEIDILIATDCISEGQNLQDCDYVINYDIHWNPVRIMVVHLHVPKVWLKLA